MASPHACLFAGLLACLSYQLHTAMADVTALKAVSQSNHKFTASIYKAMAAQNGGNLFFSPISIEVILALTYMGAGGKTAHQMLEGLNLPKDKEVVKAGFNALISSLKGNDSTVLEIANKVYTDTKVKVTNEFMSVAVEDFKSSVENVDFVNQAEEARSAINQWVATNTNDKIKELFDEGALDPSTLMVLVNAVYFKGQWATRFDPAETKPAPFHVNASHSVNVAMMKQRNWFDFDINADLEGVKILRLPYLGEKINMLIMLPENVERLAALEAKLPEIDLLKVMENLSTAEVIVKLPKCTLEKFADLKTVLQTLGMVDMFEDSADFTGLTEDTLGVKVSKVVHKAFIEVNEEGTEAAGATGSVFYQKSLPVIQKFIANHPFIFFIVDSTTSAILFAGRYVGPI